MFGTCLYGLRVELDGVLELVLLEQLVPLQLDVEGGLQVGHPEVGTGDDDVDEKDVGEDDKNDVGMHSWMVNNDKKDLSCQIFFLNISVIYHDYKGFSLNKDDVCDYV